MHIEQISNVDALFGMLALAAFAALVHRIVPLGGEILKPRRFSDAEIAAHDWALPKYFIVTTAALTIGSLHLAFRSIPSVADWLSRGGYGGHLLRDIAYTHMMIVMGGTIAVTGLTWYAMPRIMRRPLYSGALAELAFWATVIGAAGFYLSNAVFGGIMSAMVNADWSSAQIDNAVGIWRALATGISATVMGIGYWIFVLNVFLTAFGSNKAAGARPRRHLAKFFVVGAAGLLVGTIQGVLQVLPANVDWLHAAGVAGLYIDPISHAHINLITGVLSIIAGVVFYINGSDPERAGGKFVEELVFWTLVPGSVLFYAAFLYLGIKEGSLIVDQGMSFSDAARAMGWLHTWPLAIGGALTLSGIWLLLLTTWRRFSVSHNFNAGRLAILIGATALGFGTLQGIVQVVPAVRTWMIAAGATGHAIAEAHAQLNIIGGVLLMLLGSMLVIGVPMVIGSPSAPLVRRTGLLIGLGTAGYYAAALFVAIFAGVAANSGRPALAAIFEARSWVSPVMVTGAVLYFAGAGLLLGHAWRTTRTYRVEGWHRFLRALERNNSVNMPWRRRIPKSQLLLPEFAAGLFGFPGLGWILSGRATIGLPLILTGAAVSWAIFPLLLSPYGDGRLPHLTPFALELYLVAAAVISTLTLYGTMVASEHRRAHGKVGHLRTPATDSVSASVSRPA